MLVATAAGGVVWVALGGLIARALTAPDAAGLAFVVYSAHLSPMLLTEGLRRRRPAGRAGRNRRNMRFRAVRARHWPFRWVYGSMAPQVWMASLGLGLIGGWRPPVLPYICAVCLSLWRFLLVRVGPQAEGRPHTPGLRPASRTPIVLNFFADVPFILIAVVAALITQQAIWVLAAVLVVSYSFLVRAGQYVGDRGPYVYAAALVSLTCSALIVWPVSSRWYPRWDGWPTWLAIAALGAGEVLHQAADVDIPLRKRMTHIVSLLLILAFSTWTGFFGRNANFSQAAILVPARFGPDVWLTALAVALLPLGFYILLMQFGDARKWLLAERSDERNYLAWRWSKRA